jgi:isopenicillin-N epimerase
MQGGLAKMRHVKLYTPRERTLSAGLICFDVNGMQPKAVAKRLLQHRIVASTTPYGISCAHLAQSLVNTPNEVDATLRAVRALAYEGRRISHGFRLIDKKSEGT